MGWLCGAGVFGLIECSPGLAQRTTNNDNNNNNKSLSLHLFEVYRQTLTNWWPFINSLMFTNESSPFSTKKTLPCCTEAIRCYKPIT